MIAIRKSGLARKRAWFAGVVGAVAALIIGAVALDRIFPPDLARLNSLSVSVRAADGSQLRAFAAADGAWRFPVKLAEVDPKLVTYLMGYEDKRFRSHLGVDPLALVRAIGQAIGVGRVVSGASTLSMQTARLLEPRPRTLASKLIEMGRALQIERALGKDRILEAYLRLAPYGGNLEGVRAASLAYMGKEPGRLTEAEAALLVALPQSPERLRPDRFPLAAKAARDKVLRRLAEAGLLDPSTLQAALAEAAPSGRLPALAEAPHLAQRLRARMPADLDIRTGIDAGLQKQTADLAARRQRDLEAGAGIAVLVVRNVDRKVIAYIGSGGFFDARRLGQNDMVTAVRSPGSALKPFIYGLAFDDLIVHPETLILDGPMRFGDYAPENFDHRYRGQVTVREALQMSLNLPAVALLDQVGPGRFASRLAAAGVKLDLPGTPPRPGLPIALGGVGISLERMVTLYASLADGGQVKPLSFLADDRADAAGKTLMSPMAAWYLTRILEDTPPPPSWLAAGNRKAAPRIAYKTGTSYGYRDAWAVGYNAAYTVGVWVGRPDGSFSTGRMGRDAAAPILFQVFDQLPHGESALSATPPEGAILADTNRLPANLRQFRQRPGLESTFKTAAADMPRIEMPVAGATIDLDRTADGLDRLVLQAKGGRLPLRWLVNGAPLDSAPYRRQTEWQPDGAGAARITVIDSGGNSASAEVWLK